ncbi:hypothetical protein R3P38DRAFT_2772367 [Favolaschia claudopus]|uniref:CCHC-type domain-containing protein n=1 Tax=Favolaschia claudopus TaxID=2862362 RepID=A0AAW0C6U6_9AGAR
MEVNPGKGCPAEVKPRREEKKAGQLTTERIHAGDPSVLEWVHEYHCMIDVRQDNTRQILPHLTLHLAQSDFGSSMTTEVWSYAQGKPNKNGRDVTCENCGGAGHTKARCWHKGGDIERQYPDWWIGKRDASKALVPRSHMAYDVTSIVL